MLHLVYALINPCGFLDVTPIKNEGGGCSSYLLGGKMDGWYRLRYLIKPKITSARVVTVPFRVLSQEITGTVCAWLRLFLFEVFICVKHSYKHPEFPPELGKYYGSIPGIDNSVLAVQSCRCHFRAFNSLIVFWLILRFAPRASHFSHLVSPIEVVVPFRVEDFGGHAR